MNIEEYDKLSKLGRAKFITDILAEFAAQTLMILSMLYCVFNLRTILNQHGWVTLIILPVSMVIVAHLFTSIVFYANKWFGKGK